MSIEASLIDTSRPTFLFGCTPPREGTSEEKARSSCEKFVARSATLATDGYIVYDIQDEKGRTEITRPFPFRKTLDPSWFASLFHKLSAKNVVVYKSVVESSVENLDLWIDNAIHEHGHTAFNLVGAPSSKMQYQGPTIHEAMRHVSKTRDDCSFGCVSIPERHTKKGNEHQNMIKKNESGAKWFITQGIFDGNAIVKLLHDYGEACRKQYIQPSKVILTFAPCGREKTMTFIKWLGMNVPQNVIDRILNSESPVKESIKIANELLIEILEKSSGCGVPLGLSVESLSIFKDEIDGAHDMFQILQTTLLNNRGSPWSVTWYCVPTTIVGGTLSKSNLDVDLQNGYPMDRVRSLSSASRLSQLQTPLDSGRATPTKESDKNNQNDDKFILTLDSPYLYITVSIAALFGIIIGRYSK